MLGALIVDPLDVIVPILAYDSKPMDSPFKLVTDGLLGLGSTHGPGERKHPHLQYFPVRLNHF